MAGQHATLGKLVRMRALAPSELPGHPDLTALQSATTPPSLRVLIAAALDEADVFVTGYLPKNFTVKSKDRKSPPAVAPVELLAHDIPPSEIPADVRGSSPEAWFARTSIHESVAKLGTADWAEFDAGLRQNHSDHEVDYTPDALFAHKVLDWSHELTGEQATIGDWGDVTAEVREMVHKIPAPLKKRVFPVLVITAKQSDRFLVVQIPVQAVGLPNSKYDGKAADTQTGMYCSIERVQLIEDGTKVKWQMGTASDAKGILPMWIQKLGVPGAVVKDVGWFIDWCAQRRQGKA